MNDFFDKDTPIFTQSHSTGEFVSNGSVNMPVLKTMRTKYGYPNAHEKTKMYFGFTEDSIPVFIVQKYAPPAGGRSADEISVFRIKEPDGKCCYDSKFLGQLASDFLFETSSAETPVNVDLAVTTFMAFANAVSLNKEWRCHGFVHMLGSRPTEAPVSECRNGLTFEQLRNAAVISRNMDNSNYGISCALKMASMDFSRPETVMLETDELKQMLSSLEDSEYKKDGYLYLLKQDDADPEIFENLKNSPEAYDMIFTRYLKALKNNDAYELKKYHNYLPEVIRRTSMPQIRDTVNIMKNRELSFMQFVELMFLCSMTTDCEECRDYLSENVRIMRSDTDTRHRMMLYVNRNTDCIKLLSNVHVRGYEAESALLRGEIQNDQYIDDYYYLCLISKKEYRAYNRSGIADGICCLAMADFDEKTDEKDAKIADFLKHDNGRIGKKVKKMLKDKAEKDVDEKIKTALIQLKRALKEKRSKKRRLRHII